MAAEPGQRNPRLGLRPIEGQRNPRLGLRPIEVRRQLSGGVAID
jgi:hypothetical protein